MSRSAEEVARRWVGSYLGHDPDPDPADLFASKVMGFHNFDDEKIEYDGRELADMLLNRRAKVKNLMSDFHVEDFKCHVADDAFIFVQTSAGTLPDGTPVRIPGAVIWGVEGGRIVSVNSVGDHMHRAAFEEAYSAFD